MLTVASLHPIAFATQCENGATSCVVAPSELEPQEVAELGGQETNFLQFTGAYAHTSLFYFQGAAAPWTPRSGGRAGAGSIFWCNC